MATPLLVIFERQEAYQRIVDEAFESRSVETGGFLVGRQFCLVERRVLVVIAASGPGDGAERRVCNYTSDDREGRDFLDAWRERYAAYGVNYIGEWHKHPSGVQQLSSGDHMTLKGILDDQDYKLPDGIYAPVVTIDDDELHLHSYYFTRETRRPEPTPYELYEGPIADLLEWLSAQEQLSRSRPAAPEADECLRSMGAAGVLDAEVLAAETFSPETVLIDGRACAPIQPSADAADIKRCMAITQPPALLSRVEIERHALERLCASRHAQLRHTAGERVYEVIFHRPMLIDPWLITTCSQDAQADRQAPMNTRRAMTAPTLHRIRVILPDDFPYRPPNVTVRLTAGQTLSVEVDALFVNGWRPDQNLHIVLEALLAQLEYRRIDQFVDRFENNVRHMIEKGVRQPIAELGGTIARRFKERHEERGRAGDAAAIDAYHQDDGDE